jgi:hypothetical protein
MSENIVPVEFDDENQVYYITSPVFEKYFKVGDSVKWTETSPGVFVLTKVEE